MRTILKFIQKILMHLIAAATPTCDVVTRKISESFDQKLSLRDRLSIRVHTWSCVFCERYRQQLITIHRLLKNISEDDLPDIQLSPEAKERIKETMK